MCAQCGVGVFELCDADDEDECPQEWCNNFGGDDVCEAYSDYRCYMCYSDANQGTEGWSKCDPNVHKVHTFDMNFWG